jgi:hypothetical protein
VAAALLVTLAASGAAVSRWGALRSPLGLAPAAVPAQATPTPLTLSKEYVYAGGRLVATEEPTPTPAPSGPPPTNLVATASSATQVGLTWTAPAGQISHYVVERTATTNWENANSITLPDAGTSYTDSPPTGGLVVSYLYRVRAVFTSNAQSGPSNVDLATTVVFTGDDEIAPLKIIRAGHLVKLRQAVNAVRALTGLGPATWAYPDPSSVPAQRRAIYLEDVAELRSGIDPALTTLGRYQDYPATPALARGVPVHSEHFNQIRSRAE